MAIDNTDDWILASSTLTKMVKEGRRLTWRKSYNDTKDKKTLKEFNGIVSIYQVRNAEEHLFWTQKYEYLELRTLGKYHLPQGLDDLCAALFDLSFAYKLVVVDAEYLEIVVEESKDGSTNIDADVVEAFQKTIGRQVQQ